MNHSPAPDVIIIGAGAFGLWTALAAAERGARVVVIDMRDVGNIRASSGGASRNIRAGYGADVFYTRLAIEARAAWQLRETQLGQRLLYPAGALISRNPELFAEQAEVALRYPASFFFQSGQPYGFPPFHYRRRKKLSASISASSFPPKN